ncbi:MAG: endonuclease, partial [Muribaculaceae bacterium]|nr:endonuclease [Muribaculaceae bacterium]
MNDLRIIAFAAATAAALCASADAPQGYYDSCEGKSGRALLQQLETVVGPHTNVGYDGLWSVYKTSDIRPEDGTVWDMYSTKRWTFGTSQCGNYKNVGDCYNREHSMPKSWFSEGQPMKSDAFHVYPTDGKVNGQRSNHPYGECASGTTLPANGSVKALGKLGSSTFPGYSGTVFEPVDEYKGDFARTYFYMAAAYNSKISNWSSPMLAGNSYPAYT